MNKKKLVVGIKNKLISNICIRYIFEWSYIFFLIKKIIFTYIICTNIYVYFNKYTYTDTHTHILLGAIKIFLGNH